MESLKYVGGGIKMENMEPIELMGTGIALGICVLWVVIGIYHLVNWLSMIWWVKHQKRTIIHLRRY